MYAQLVHPTFDPNGRQYWCLEYAQLVYRAPVMYPTALTAWHGQRGRHPGEQPPRGVSVPVWMDYWHEGVNKGHVAAMLPDGRVLSSPVGKLYGYTVFANLDAMLHGIREGSPKYLGWSEYMHTVQVVRMRTEETEKKRMGKSQGRYIGGNDKTPPNERVCLIFYPESGYHELFSGTDQAYINDQARCHDTGNFGRMTKNHWESQVKPMLDRILAR